MNAKELPKDWEMPGKACIISQILQQDQVSWCWRHDKGSGCSRLSLPCALLMATSRWSRGALRATGAPVDEVKCIFPVDWLIMGWNQWCYNQDSAGWTPAKPQRRFELERIKINSLNFKLAVYWKEWQIGKNGLFRNQITKATRVRMKKMASGSTCSS